MTTYEQCLNLLPMVEKTNKHQDFANRLNAEMAKKRFFVKDLAAACGVTYEMARRYTLGTAKPRGDKLEKIADWLGVGEAWLDYGTRDSASQLFPPLEIDSLLAEVNAENEEFSQLNEDEKRLLRIFRKYPEKEAKNMILAFEKRYKQLYELFSPPPE